jgi:hypothetical protein
MKMICWRCGQKKIFDAEGHNSNVVDLGLEHSPGALRHLRALTTGGGDQKLVFPLDRCLLELSNKFRKKGLVISETMKPNSLLFSETRARACVLENN